MRLFVMALALLPAAPALAAETSPSNVHVRSVSYAGSGCPSGTVSTTVSSDQKAFSFLFDSYAVDNAPGQPLSATRKNCQLAVGLSYPSGWQYAVRSVKFRGVARLGAGQTAQASAAYYYSGVPMTGRYTVNVAGPLDAEWEATDSLGDSALVWSVCGASRALNLNTQLRITSASSRAYGKISIGNLYDWLPDVSPTTELNFAWRRCAR